MGKKGRSKMDIEYVFKKEKYLIILYTIFYHKEYVKKHIDKKIPLELKKKKLKYYLIKNNQLDFKEGNIDYFIAEHFLIDCINMKMKSQDFSLLNRKDIVEEREKISNELRGNPEGNFFQHYKSIL